MGLDPNSDGRGLVNRGLPSTFGSRFSNSDFADHRRGWVLHAVEKKR